MYRAQVPVKRPFRLDLTARALQRLGTNVVDVVTADGMYARALNHGKLTDVICVRQTTAGLLDVEIFGGGGSRMLSTVGRMLGTAVDLRPWDQRVKSIAWLERLSRMHRGLRPPRYPTLWEALVHAIVFQQISIHAAGAIMRRLVVGLSKPAAYQGIELYPFPEPQAILGASDSALRAAGSSANKAGALKGAAEAVLEGTIAEARLEQMESADAILELSKLRGIGPWSAAVVLLRGLGRLNVFPLKDSGAAGSLKLLSGDATLDLGALLLQLGDQRGMLYFHLLIGRLAHRRGEKNDERDGRRADVFSTTRH